MTSVPITVRARWILSPDEAPLKGHFVTFNESEILRISSSSDGPFFDLDDLVLLPGFVNPHTHLEFSDCDHPLGETGMPFTAWLRLVIQSRIGTHTTNKQAALHLGLQQVIEAGTACVGEIATSPWHLQQSMETPLEVVAFQEWLSLDPARLPSLQENFKELYQASSQQQQFASRLNVSPAISPHAPYTVHPALFEQACQHALQHGLPLAMHLAETKEELELLRQNQGPFREFLESLGVYRNDAFQSERDIAWYLKRMSSLPRSLVIHGNYLDTPAIDLISQHRDSMSVVYCPRTHSYFQHDRYPLEEYLQKGVRVAIGTDSKASTPSLEPWEEMRHAILLHPQIDPSAIFRMVTIDAAKSLGKEKRFGRIAVGYASNLNAISIGSSPEPQSFSGLLDSLLASDARLTPLAISQIAKGFPPQDR